MDEHDLHEEERELTYQWVVQHAERDHGGDFAEAAICHLNAARLREQNPNLWAEQEAIQRGWRRPKARQEAADHTG